MKYALIGAVVAIVIIACVAGDGPHLLKSVIHGFGWGIGREIAHRIIHHVLR